MDKTDQQLQQLNETIRRCQRCRLAQTRTHALCGEGDTHARLMLIAQAPGDTEDRDNQMFIGPSGQILNSLLSTAGVTKDAIYMTNLLKCRLPGCRRPKKDEIDACSEFLDREISLINPDVLVPLGYYATRYCVRKFALSLPESRSEVADLFGTVIPLETKRLYPLPHPASLIYHEEYWHLTQVRYQKLRQFV